MPKDLLETWKNEPMFSHSVDCQDRIKCCLSALELQAYVICLLEEQKKRDAEIFIKNIWRVKSKKDVMAIQEKILNK